MHGSRTCERRNAKPGRSGRLTRLGPFLVDVERLVRDGNGACIGPQELEAERSWLLDGEHCSGSGGTGGDTPAPPAPSKTARKGWTKHRGPTVSNVTFSLRDAPRHPAGELAGRPVLAGDASPERL